MAGPHPVVGVASELADRRRRGAHQTDVTVDLIDKEEILVGIVKRLHLGLDALVGVGNLLHDGVAVGLDQRVALRLGHRRLIAAQDRVRDVVHPLQEADGQARVGQLLAAGHRPEAIFEIVVLHAAVALDLAESAVVVGKEQAVARDELARAAGAEQHDGVLERRLVDAIDIFGREPEAVCLHIFDALRDQHRQPHSLICTQRQGRDQQERGQDQVFLHIVGINRLSVRHLPLGAVSWDSSARRA